MVPITATLVPYFSIKTASPRPPLPAGNIPAIDRAKIRNLTPKNHHHNNEHNKLTYI